MSASLATAFPAIDPDITARLTDDLLAIVPRPGQASHDAFSHDTTLIAERDAFHPRDLEEAILATQMLAMHHNAVACLQAAQQHDIASAEASRLRRDAIAHDRAAIAVLRALHKSQARPMQEDPETLVARPTVPAAKPRRPAQQSGPRAPARTHARAAGAAEAGCADPPTQAEPGVPAARWSRVGGDPLAGKPELQRLRDNWDTLPDWRTMTMEQRRETWGYKLPPERTAGTPDTTPQGG